MESMVTHIGLYALINSFRKESCFFDTIGHNRTRSLSARQLRPNLLAEQFRSTLHTNLFDLNDIVWLCPKAVHFFMKANW